MGPKLLEHIFFLFVIEHNNGNFGDVIWVALSTPLSPAHDGNMITLSCSHQAHGKCRATMTKGCKLSIRPPERDCGRGDDTMRPACFSAVSYACLTPPNGVKAGGLFGSIRIERTNTRSMHVYGRRSLLSVLRLVRPEWRGFGSTLSFPGDPRSIFIAVKGTGKYAWYTSPSRRLCGGWRVMRL